MSSERENHLYRWFDAEGCLLYIGISFNAYSRASQHFKNQDASWTDSAVRMEVERFETREEVAKAERLAIQNEKPRYNIQYQAVSTAVPRKKTSSPRPKASPALEEPKVTQLSSERDLVNILVSSQTQLVSSLAKHATDTSGGHKVLMDALGTLKSFQRVKETHDTYPDAGNWTVQDASALRLHLDVAHGKKFPALDEELCTRCAVLFVMGEMGRPDHKWSSVSELLGMGTIVDKPIVSGPQFST